MPGSEPQIVGIVPAAGEARRLGRLPCSKELLPVAPAPPGGSGAVEVAIESLLSRFAAAGIPRAYVVMDGSKGDLPRYLAEPGRGPSRRPALAFLSVTASPSLVHSLDRAHPFLAPEPAPWVALGFPDVIFEPVDAFRHLIERRRRTGAPLVLGLFPADDPGSTDMVETDSAGAVRRIEVRPRASELRFNWLIALWDRRFTEHLHRYVDEADAPGSGELELGYVFARAVAEGMEVQSVAFPEGRFRDLGSPTAYATVLRDPLQR